MRPEAYMSKARFPEVSFLQVKHDITCAQNCRLLHTTILTHSLPHVGDIPLILRYSLILRGQDETHGPSMEVFFKHEEPGHR